MTSIGPFSIRVVIVFVAVLVAWTVARTLAKRLLPDTPYKAAGGMIFDALLLGLLFARLAYIAQWWREYSAAPMSMLSIGDGGYAWWAGIPAALIFIAWRTRAQRPLRRPVLAGVLAGILTWVGAGGVIELLQRSAPPLPELQLASLDAQPIDLTAYRGRPIVLNLWASWCPPCRREMPAFEQAQQAFPDVAFVMLNQGESAQQARAFLQKDGLHFSDVLLDPSSQAMQALGSRGLPTTFFFDAQGRLVHSHMGELTLATLSSAVKRRFAPSLEHSQDKE
ncbi:TlpA family protein disulfide reductase [Stenotrophomonas sp. MH181796]|uniref:TlpA family protein disulfide reductase n=1 Tax=Pseudomonadota TaxID=1224 RepID=UPI00129C795D|nr:MULTISPECIES: TlpA disulfide reductase family protein [Pseudomonadota]MCD0497231.1 TlpA family protein disulfide reductase [Achromobacter sp. MY14]MDN4684199.1 TlpA disulfide reductase family protein [Pseudomonas aeruginosa]MDP5439757.1 TlpA disulfide reductase family protein [Pseudomonas aeruginosa]MRI42035.1 TlpA family protein disulfide reductase [Stenotrophomonas sp. MH181796]